MWRAAEPRDAHLVCRGQWRGRCARQIVAVRTLAADTPRGLPGTRRTGYCAEHLAPWDAWVDAETGRLAWWVYVHENAAAWREGPATSPLPRPTRYDHEDAAGVWSGC
jgi:hypothetical protein